MLEQKKISTKINYDVLKDLNVKPSPSQASEAESPKLKQSATRTAGSNRRPAPTRTPLSLSTPLSTLGKRLQPFISKQPNKKLAVEKTEATSSPTVTEVAHPSEVVVEHGPVIYDDVEEEEDEEEPCVSAMELLGGDGYGCDGEYDDGY
uniref:Brf1 TBP-binding domain-containing protein n=2 Tax=Cyprinodon variegatus TaxID=28743 RepID=A0A3Q2GMX4_CYPVA